MAVPTLPPLSELTGPTGRSKSSGHWSYNDWEDIQHAHNSNVPRAETAPPPPRRPLTPWGLAADRPFTNSQGFAHDLGLSIGQALNISSSNRDLSVMRVLFQRTPIDAYCGVCGALRQHKYSCTWLFVCWHPQNSS